MVALKNIVWVGTGKTGLPTLHTIAASSDFKIDLLVRNPVSTYSSLPSRLASITQVDYTSHDALVDLLKSKSADAIIVFSSFAPRQSFDLKHIALIDAAIEAGVRYFIPSEWALDTAGDSESTSDKIGPTLPTTMVLAPKRVSHNYLLCRASEGKIGFAAIYCGVIVEACLKNRMLQFDFASKTANLADNGIPSFPATSITTLSKAITGLLVNPSRINNSFYHISDGVLTQSEMLRVIEKESGSVWKKSSFSTETERRKAVENMKNGTFGMMEYVGVLRTAFFAGIQAWLRTDNEALGIKDEDTVDMREEVARLAREHLENAYNNLSKM